MRSPTKTPTPLPDAGDARPTQGGGAAVVRGPARPDLRRIRAPGGRTFRPPSRPAARPLRAQGLAARARPRRRGSRRRHHGRHARPRVREGGGQRLDRVRRVQPRVPQPDPGRRRGSALLRLGHLAGGTYALAQGAGHAHEHPPHRDHARLVRRRRGSHAHGAARGRYAGLPCRAQGRLRPPRPGLLSALQAMVRRILPPAAPRRAARRGRHLLRRSRQRRLRARLRLHPRRRRGLPRGLSRAGAPRT